MLMIWLNFFLFFKLSNIILVPDDAEAELDDETQALVTSDFEIGHYIRERIVPRAVLYYTGNLVGHPNNILIYFI